MSTGARATGRDRLAEWIEVDRAAEVLRASRSKRFYFMHKGCERGFGPYLTASDARDAFHRAYGYWPGALVREVPWLES